MHAMFGMNHDFVGFLMNDWRIDRLAERIEAAKPIRVAPLEMKATTVGGQVFTHSAINEVSLLRETRQTAKIEDFGQRPRRLCPNCAWTACYVATPAGSKRPPTTSRRAGQSCLGRENARTDPDQPVSPRRWSARSCRRHRGLLRDAHERQPSCFPPLPTTPRCATLRRWKYASTASAR